MCGGAEKVQLKEAVDFPYLGYLRISLTEGQSLGYARIDFAWNFFGRLFRQCSRGLGYSQEK